MQKDVKKAALWYLENFTDNLEDLGKELLSAARVRDWALGHGTIEQIERAFAAVEILKAAYALQNNEFYETDFSATSLDLIRKYSFQKPKLFTCQKCGGIYPATAFGTDKLTGKQSHFCIRCVKEIDQIQKQYIKVSKGYITSNGTIICAC